MNKYIFSLLPFFILTLQSNPAFAANALDDVPASDWSYSAVNKLIDDGVIDTKKDSTIQPLFSSSKMYTRYEMALLTARAIAHENTASQEDQKIIQKLRASFSEELIEFGIKPVTKKQDPLKLTGSFDMRYTDKVSTAKKSSSKVTSQYRIRLNAVIPVSNSSKLHLRVGNALTEAGNNFTWTSSNWMKFGNNGANGNTSTYSNLAFDRVYVSSAYKDALISYGHLPIKFGQNNFVMDGGIYAFDGINIHTPNKNYAFDLNYGRFEDNVDLWSVEASMDSNKLKSSLGYMELADNNKNIAGWKNNIFAKYIDFSNTYNFTQNLGSGIELVANEATNSAYQDKGRAFYGYLRIGKAALKKRNDQNLNIGYYRSNANGLTMWSHLNKFAALGINGNITEAYGQNKPAHALTMTYTRALDSRTSFYLWYMRMFDDDVLPISKGNGNFNLYRVGLSVKF